MNEDIIPGVIPAPPAAPKTSTLTHKGKLHHFVCEVGKPLSFDTLGQVPKKVLKKASKMWRKLNPPKQGMQFPWSGFRCNYHREVLMKDWLKEKAGAA